MTIYSNPRMAATITDWPNGKHRVTATFSIESDPKKGERAVRVTTGKPVKLTYGAKMRIVDGDDGRTYIAVLYHYSGFVGIMNGDMKYQHETVPTGDPRHAELLKLFAGQGSC